ncbi:MAG: HAD family phosphatase [Patulibacter sp.]|nr:HAD family phosphatase [Patulibacter sp.]
MAARALVIDFGGVLTGPVGASFGDFCRSQGLPESRFVDLLVREPAAGRLLIGVEKGEISLAEFERGMAPLLGPSVPADGLVRGLTATLQPDQVMRDAVATLRLHGVRTVLLSNSLGRDPYAGLDCERLFDHVLLSEDLGLRKPSNAIYAHALEVAGVDGADAVFVDDLDRNCAGAERLGMRAILHRDAATTVPQLAAAFAVPLTAGAASASH